VSKPKPGDLYPVIPAKALEVERRLSAIEEKMGRRNRLIHVDPLSGTLMLGKRPFRGPTLPTDIIVRFPA